MTRLGNQTGKIRRLPLLFGTGVATAALALLLLTFFSEEIFPEYSPAHRGFEVAREAGCFSCHGPYGAEGSSNPTRDGHFDSVPSLFDERLPLEAQREWIENGMTDEKSGSASYLARRENKVLVMPGFKEDLSAGDIDDLVAYLSLMQYRHAAEQGSFTPSGGEDLARRFACFSCHGELGQGGIENPRSLKGYIPGFFGADFRALTRNGRAQDIREWIRDGHSDYFINQGFAGFYPGRFFSRRQAIKMPAFGKFLSSGELDILVDYLLELMEQGPLTGPALLRYYPLESVGSRTQSPPRDTNLGNLSSEELFSRAGKILEENCLKCHGPEKQRSGFRLDYRDAVLQGGEIVRFTGTPSVDLSRPENSLIVRFIQAEEKDSLNEIYPMPPDDNPRLTDEQIQILKAWIEAGLPWEEGVILQPAE